MSILTQDELKTLLHYDPETGDFTWRLDLGPGRPDAGDVAGRIQLKKCGKSYRDIGIRGRRYYAHRLAHLYMTGEWPEDQVDHRNGDGTDNRWVNLRDVSDQENSMNVRRRCDNTSTVTGVHLNKLTDKWEAYISVNKVRHHLGLFRHFDHAVAARKKAEKEHGFHENHGQVRPL